MLLLLLGGTYDVAVHQPSTRVVGAESEREPSATWQSGRIPARGILKGQGIRRRPGAVSGA